MLDFFLGSVRIVRIISNYLQIFLQRLVTEEICLIGGYISSQLRAAKICYSSRIKEISLYISYVISGLGITALTVGVGLLSVLGGASKLVLAWFFLGGFVYLFNDVFDREADRINERDLPLAMGRVTLNQIVGISLISLIFALTISFSVNRTIFLLAVIAAGLGIAYSIPFLRLKKINWAKPLTIASALALSLLAGGFSLGAVPIELIFLILSFGIFTMLAYPTADLKDMEGDKKHGIRTIPILIGKKRTLEMGILGFSVMLTSAILGYVYLSFNFTLIFMAGAVSCFNIKELYYQRLHEGSGGDDKNTCKRSLISATLFPLIFLIGLI